MRGKWAIIASVGLALLAGACDPTRDMRYLREGIGTDLYWDGLSNATALQDTYLSYVCAQAISPGARSGDAATCGFLSLAPREWGLLVQAGMNDIDLRCNSYLAWLHDKRASREPFLKQLAAMGGATAAILKATDQSALSIALAGIAFGLAADTFTNIDMRLLNGVDYTTVQSVVRGNRSEFRLNNLSLVIDNRPAAIYVLRSYLTLCMPSSIEMSINNTINIFQRGGAEALRTPQISLRMPVATSDRAATVRRTAVETLVKSIPDSSRGPLRGTKKEDQIQVTVINGGITAAELKLPRVVGQAIQANLCVPATGEFDDETRQAIRQAKLGGNGSRDGTFTNTKNELSTPREVEIFAAARACNVDTSGKDRGYAVAYEKFRFPDDPGVKQLQRRLMKCDATVKETGVFDTDTRNGIKTAKALVKADPIVGANLTDAEVSTNTLNNRTYLAIVRKCF